jgi:ribosome-associated translation inhibitor RaiA
LFGWLIVPSIRQRVEVFLHKEVFRMFSVNFKGIEPIDLVREEMNKSLEWLEGGLPRGAEIHLSVEPRGRSRRFNLVLSVRTLQRRLVAHASGENLLSLVRALKKQIDRQVHRIQDRRITRRRWNKKLYPNLEIGPTWELG